MATSVYSWSTTAGTNASADSNINWAEGQLPSTVNDSARAMMAALAAMIRDQGGYAATTGSSNTYVLALSQTMSAAVPALIGFRANHTNTGAATLNVDSLGAQPLRMQTGVALQANDILSGCNYVATWNSTSSEWLLINPMPAALRASSVLGTPASGTLTNCTGLPVSTGISGLAANMATFLATSSSANLASTVTDETGSGALVFANSPTLVTPALGTPASGTLTNCTGLPTAGLVDAAVTPTKMSQPFTTATAVASTSGSNIDFTSIPSWVRRIVVIFNGVSTNTTSPLGIQIGTGGSPTTSGYASRAFNFSTNAGGTTNFLLCASTTSAGSSVNGHATLTYVSANVWVLSSILIDSTASAFVSFSTGTVSLSGALDNVRIQAGVGSFDAGSINIQYE